MMTGDLQWGIHQPVGGRGGRGVATRRFSFRKGVGRLFPMEFGGTRSSCERRGRSGGGSSRGWVLLQQRMREGNQRRAVTRRG